MVPLRASVVLLDGSRCFASWCRLPTMSSRRISRAPRRAKRSPLGGESQGRRLEERILDQLIAHVAASTRALQVAESPSARISKPPAVAPGAPPLLSFRYFDGKQRHRFGNLDLVMDDAGH